MSTLNNRVNGFINELLGVETIVNEITINELENVLRNFKGNKVVSLLQLTSQNSKLSAKNARENELLKLSKMTVLAGTDTNVRVNNQLAREGKEANYDALPTYMEKINNVLGQNIKNPKVKYFITFPFDNSKPKSFLFLNKNEVKQNDIKDLYKPSALKDYDNISQGTDKKIAHMRPKLESLLAVKFDNILYIIK